MLRYKALQYSYLDILWSSRRVKGYEEKRFPKFGGRSFLADKIEGFIM